MSSGRGAVNAQEPDAGWTGRGGKTVLGYKAHVGVDQGSGLVRRVVVTSARVYESEVADDLICATSGRSMATALIRSRRGARG